MTKFHIQIIGIEVILVQTLELVDVDFENLVTIVPRPLLRARMSNIEVNISHGKSTNLRAEVSDFSVKNLWNKVLPPFSNLICLEKKSSKPIKLKVFLPNDPSQSKSWELKVEPLQVFLDPDLLRQLTLFISACSFSERVTAPQKTSAALEEETKMEEMIETEEDSDSSLVGGVHWSLQFDSPVFFVCSDLSGLI